MKNKTGAKIRQSQTNPIPDLQEINRIRSLIRFRNRDLLLFDLALETGSPASQLLQLKVCDLQGLNVGDEVAALGIKPERNGPTTIGPKTHETFQRYLEELNPDTEDFLFKSRKGNGPLSISSASRIASRWFEEAGLEKMSGLLSLRKTWADYYNIPPTKQKKATFFEKPEPGYALEFIKNTCLKRDLGNITNDWIIC